MAAAAFPDSSSDFARSRRGEVEEFWANTNGESAPVRGDHPWPSEELKLPSTNNTTIRTNVFMNETVLKEKYLSVLSVEGIDSLETGRHNNE